MSISIPNNLTPVAVIIFWLLVGLYFGSGGITKLENDNLIKKTLTEVDTAKVTYQGAVFRNKNALISKLETDQMDQIYPWLDSVPSFVAYLITACAFGLLGSIIGIIYKMVLGNEVLINLKYWSAPILGLLTGIMVLGISFVLPSTIFNSDAEIKPSALMFICLFCGLYSTQFYEKLGNIFSKIFK